MPRSRNRPSVIATAGRGAVAGLVGGAVMTAAERIVLPRLPDRHAPRVARCDARLGDAAASLGWALSPEARTVVSIATQLACASLLGAGYAVALHHLRPSRAGRQLLDAGLVFGASLLAPELPRKRRRRKPRGRGARLRHAARQRLLDPVTPTAVFGRATSFALKALMR